MRSGRPLAPTTGNGSEPAGSELPSDLADGVDGGHSHSLWSRSQLRSASLASGAALGLVVAGWYGAAQEVSVSHQLPWLNVALVGVVVSAATNGTGLLRARQKIGGRIRLLRETLERDTASRRTPTRTLPQPRTDLVAAPAMRYFHRTDCPLAVGKPVRKATRVAHGRANREPCRVCEP